MKKWYLFLLAAFCLSFVSCSDDPDSLSSRRVCGLLNDRIEDEGEKKGYANLQTGYYENNSLESRQKLMKLQAAGIITYDVERFAWYNKITQRHYDYDWYYGVTERYTTTYDLEEHFLVKVALTEKGMKLQVDSIPTPEEKGDEDMKKLKVKLSEFPETGIDLTENWPEIPYPGKQAANTSTSSRSTSSSGSSRNTTSDDEEVNKHPNALDQKTAAAYEAALAKVNGETAILLAYEVKADKACNIKIYEGEDGVTASADAVVKYKKVTDVGRIAYGIYQGQLFKVPVHLNYCLDKGWRIDKVGEPTYGEVEIVKEDIAPKKKAKEDKKTGVIEEIDSIAVCDTTCIDTAGYY